MTSASWFERLNQRPMSGPRMSVGFMTVYSRAVEDPLRASR
jgi:hypothetical protein